MFKRLYNSKTIYINGRSYFVELASTLNKIEEGYQQKNMINDGMLFIYTEELINLIYHMNNVYFPLDMISINGKNRVNKIYKAQPNEQKIVFNNAKYILELREGLGEEISIGDKFEYTRHVK